MSEQNQQIKTPVRLDNKTLRKSWFNWICWGQICYNYERMMGLGFCQAMIPLFKKLYPNDKKKQADGMTRHLTFYNTENTWGSIILGIVASLEEAKANGEEIDDDMISNMKTALMGPIAGIGDSVTQALVKVILLAIAIDFALKGSAVGTIIFILGFSAYALLVSYFSFFSGYRLGQNSVIKLLKGNLVHYITEALGAVGMVVLGGLVANNMNITTKLAFSMNGIETNLQSILDTILPNLLNLSVFLLAFILLRKGKKPNTVMLVLFVVASVLSLLTII